MSISKSKEGFIEKFLLKKSSIIEIVIVAIIAALGANLVSQYLIEKLLPYPNFTFYVGLVFCLIAIGYFSLRFLSTKNLVKEYEGFFIYNNKKNILANIPHYDFSEDLNSYLEAAFYENPALKFIWDKQPLSKIKTLMEQSKEADVGSIQLITEAIEYFVLNNLSTYLTDYFHDPQFKEDNLIQLSRKDIPQVLLENRFLELFSKPMYDRPLFIKDTLNKKVDDHEVVASYIGKAMYEKFDLVLPKNSIVRRVKKNKIQIETNRLILEIESIFEGMNTYLPFEFTEKYLSLKIDDIEEYTIIVRTKVSFKFGALISGKSWEYYQWIDSFLECLDKTISKEMFFEQIGWKQALTVIEYIEKSSKKRQSA